MEYTELIRQAFKAREHSYAPYSGFRVGAAICCLDGTVYQGCNIENAAYSPGNCAERTAIFKAVSEGQKDFTAIAIVGDPDRYKGEILPEYCPPCGVCRQVMMEFCNPKEFKVIVAKSVNDYKVYFLEELLPMGFGPTSLGDS